MTINSDSLSEVINNYLENFFNSQKDTEGASIDDLENMYRQCVEALERPLFIQVMVNVEHNQTKAAKILGLNRNTFREKLKKYHML